MNYTAYIGLGSNLASAAGEPAETIRAAARALVALGTVSAFSSLYRTAPVGLREQPDFINAALRLETNLEPDALLGELLAVERQFGRDRSASPPKGPRTLDLDLLLMADARGEGVICPSQHLTLPHPEMVRRRFVLAPLAEIAPDVRHPVLGRTVGELLKSLESLGAEDGVRLLEPR